MPCFRFIFLVACLVSCFAVATADAQVLAKPRHAIGAWQPGLLTGASILLGGQFTAESLLDHHDAVAWHQNGELPAYHEMNRRALRLRGCRAYLYQAGNKLPGDSLWRERLSNYGIQVIETTSAATNAELRTLSEELCRLFPDRHKQIQENLYQELDRRRTGRERLNLAQHQPE